MNPAKQVLEVAESMLEGEILYREGRCVNEAISALEEAVRREEQFALHRTTRLDSTCPPRAGKQL